MKDGALWRLPLFLSIMEAFDLDKPAAWRSGMVGFSVKNRTMFVDRLKFESASMRLDGSGTLDADGELDITLTSWFAPETIPRIPIVSRLWTRFKRNVIPIRITGPMRGPDAQLRPLQGGSGR